MPTIKQLPAATSVAATDLLPLSQNGMTKALAVGSLLSTVQPAISLASSKLLGRVSLTAGGPEVVGIGTGLTIAAGSVAATGADHTQLPISPGLQAGDEVVVNSGGLAKRMLATLLRGLFTGGNGISIDGTGTISSTGGAGFAGVSTFNARSGPVTLTSADLTGVGGALSTNLPQGATSAPPIDGAGAVGISLLYARQDHVHPTDTSRLSALSNLSELVSPTTARTNLGLGGVATLNVGTTTGTVAAGNDSRVTGALQTTSLGQLGSAFGPLVNFSGSGLPGIYLPTGLVFGNPSTSATDDASLYIQRVANYTGGQAGFVNGTLKLTNDTSAGVATDENGLVVILNNSSTAADAGENCAIVGQANRFGTGATWVTDLEMRDHAGSDPVAGSIVAELDHRANGTDNTHNRVGVALYITKLDPAGAPNQMSRGYEISNAGEGTSGSSIRQAYTIGYAGAPGQSPQYFPVGYAFDCRFAVPAPGFSAVTALAMASGHLIDVKGDGSRTLSYNVQGGLQYLVSGSLVFQVSDLGQVLTSELSLSADGKALLHYHGDTGDLTYSYNGNAVFTVNQTGAVGILSGAVSGVLTAPTPASGSNSTQVATTAFVQSTVQGAGVRITSGASYTMAVGDRFIVVKKTAGSATAIALPASPTLWAPYVIKDGTGDAVTNMITISSTAPIDGAATFVINNAYESATLMFDGVEWSVI